MINDTRMVAVRLCCFVLFLILDFLERDMNASYIHIKYTLSVARRNERLTKSFISACGAKRATV